MNSKNVNKIVVIGLVAAPVILCASVKPIVKGYAKMKKKLYDRKIEKGLQNGTIVEINGEYHAVTPE